MRVTRDVDPADVGDLLVAAPRATLALVVDGTTDLLPVQAGEADGGYRVDLGPQAAGRYDGADALLVLDDGTGWWDLRAVTVRGRLRDAGRGRYLLVARRTRAWDYGRLRPADGEDDAGSGDGPPA